MHCIQHAAYHNKNHRTVHSLQAYWQFGMGPCFYEIKVERGIKGHHLVNKKKQLLRDAAEKLHCNVFLTVFKKKKEEAARVKMKTTA